MMNKIFEMIMKHYIGIIRVLMLGINAFLLYWALYFTNVIQYFIAIISAVIINSYYLIHEFLTFKRPKTFKDYEKTFQDILEDMEDAEALNEEVFSSSLKAPVDDDRVDMSDDEAKSVNQDDNFISNDSDEVIETAEILKPQQVIERESTFEQAIQNEDYIESLVDYMKDNGLLVDMNTVRETFACLASSRLFIFHHENAKISERYLEIFTDYIGANFSSSPLADNETSIDDLFTYNHDFNDGIIRAKSDKNKINIESLTDVNLKSFHDGFKELVTYALNPFVTPQANETSGDDAIDMPSNVWIAVIPKQFDQSHLEQELLESAVILDIKAKPVKPKATVYQNSIKLSYQNMMNLIEEGSEQYYLEEDEWKKFDQIEQYFNQKTDFAIDNRLFRQLERFASTFLMFGGDSKEVIDRLLFAKLLPIISTIDINGKRKKEEDMLDLFEKLFGLEYLNKSKTLLKSMNTNNTPIT